MGRGTHGAPQKGSAQGGGVKTQPPKKSQGRSKRPAKSFERGNYKKGAVLCQGETGAGQNPFNLLIIVLFLIHSLPDPAHRGKPGGPSLKAWFCRCLSRPRKIGRGGRWGLIRRFERRGPLQYPLEWMRGLMKRLSVDTAGWMSMASKSCPEALIKSPPLS